MGEVSVLCPNRRRLFSLPSYAKAASAISAVLYWGITSLVLVMSRRDMMRSGTPVRANLFPLRWHWAHWPSIAPRPAESM